MTPLKVKILEAATGKTSDVKLPDDMPVGKLLVELAKSLGVGNQTQGTELKLSYKTPNPPDPFQFQDNDTLQAKGVREGSTLVFTHSFTAGRR